MAFPGRDSDAEGGTSGFLSSFQPQLNHESGPPGLKTDVLGVVVACHPAQQQPLPEQEEAQGALRRGEHQTKAWRVRKSRISCVTCNLSAASVVKIYLLAPGSYLFCMLLYSASTNKSE